MKLQRLKQAPVLIVACVLALVCLARVLQIDFFERLERITYDIRARMALRFPSPAAANLGFVFISDDSIAALNNGSLGFHYGLYWPRHIYGRLYRELAAQNAKSVAFDILFREPRQDHAQVPVSNAKWPEVNEFLAALHRGQNPVVYEDQNEKLTLMESDDYFAWQLKRGGTAILAAERDVMPFDLFATNALVLADISADCDADGVLRRAKAFRVYRKWHAAFKQVEANPAYGVDLGRAKVESGRILLPRANGEEILIPIDAENNFDLADFGGEKLPPGMARKAKAFTDEIVWHMGIVLAARELNLDLPGAVVDLTHGRITLRGAGGVGRVIPVDTGGYFYINWELTTADRHLTMEAIEGLLEQDQIRTGVRNGTLTNRWANKLVVVGSSATGNDLTDRGATPLEKDAFLVTKHWNVANSILTGRFVHRASLGMELALIVALGVLTAFLTWQWRVFPASAGVVLLAILYCAAGLFLYVQYRYWLPLVLPIVGAMIIEHGMLLTYRVVFEQTERRRIKTVFSKIVSPEVVNELLRAEKLSLGGARREVTVLFADVRGFTELTDYTQERVADYVREHKLSHDVAEACFDEFSKETLNTVSLYLTCVINAAIKHKGIFDKFIGDCVMAFWGAPTVHPQHALACVRAAIDAQRAIYKLNQQRAAQNPQRELENRARASAGLPPKPPLPTLTLGTGINTGLVTAGLMGSEAHFLNYTVFGREVNLASRLEGISGRGRIIIGEATYQHLLRDDPALAATCVEKEPTTPKGFNKPVRIYEVPWMPPGTVAEDFQTMFFVKPQNPPEIS
ncbi:MAG: CHASE2 domain-containing protein [Verrucomicrobia bacterium]|nr:CHASE2 domain-containing protein [Verrucomicrobiota bacterium]